MSGYDTFGLVLVLLTWIWTPHQCQVLVLCAGLIWNWTAPKQACVPMLADRLEKRARPSWLGKALCLEMGSAPRCQTAGSWHAECRGREVTPLVLMSEFCFHPHFMEKWQQAMAHGPAGGKSEIRNPWSGPGMTHQTSLGHKVSIFPKLMIKRSRYVNSKCRDAITLKTRQERHRELLGGGVTETASRENVSSPWRLPPRRHGNRIESNRHMITKNPQEG